MPSNVLLFCSCRIASLSRRRRGACCSQAGPAPVSSHADVATAGPGSGSLLILAAAGPEFAGATRNRYRSTAAAIVDQTPAPMGTVRATVDDPRLCVASGPVSLQVIRDHVYVRRSPGYPRGRAGSGAESSRVAAEDQPGAGEGRARPLIQIHREPAVSCRQKPAKRCYGTAGGQAVSMMPTTNAAARRSIPMPKCRSDAPANGTLMATAVRGGCRRRRSACCRAVLPAVEQLQAGEIAEQADCRRDRCVPAMARTDELPSGTTADLRRRGRLMGDW